MGVFSSSFLDFDHFYQVFEKDTTIKKMIDLIGSGSGHSQRTIATDKFCNMEFIVPGIPKESLNVFIEDGNVTVEYPDRETKKTAILESKLDLNVYDPDTVKSTYRDGILNLTFDVYADYNKPDKRKRIDI